MDILFEDDRLRVACNDNRAAQKKWGQPSARKLRSRLDDLAAAKTLDDVRNLPGRCHELVRDRKGQLAMDLHGALRLIFRPREAPPPVKQDGGLDWKKVESIVVVSVEDYHE